MARVFFFVSPLSLFLTIFVFNLMYEEKEEEEEEKRSSNEHVVREADGDRRSEQELLLRLSLRPLHTFNPIKQSFDVLHAEGSTYVVPFTSRHTHVCYGM
jgi:hypothetical protein